MGVYNETCPGKIKKSLSFARSQGLKASLIYFLELEWWLEPEWWELE
jgi:hypothetical protein